TGPPRASWRVPLGASCRFAETLDRRHVPFCRLSEPQNRIPFCWNRSDGRHAMTLVCGLDFGTSNSTIARLDAAGVPHLLPLEGGRPTIPSVVFFGFEDDAIHFGRQAVAEYVSGAEGRLMRSLKSVLGTGLMGDTTRVKAKRYGFLDILGLFIAELKRRAEGELGGAIDTVVCG